MLLNLTLWRHCLSRIAQFAGEAAQSKVPYPKHDVGMASVSELSKRTGEFAQGITKNRPLQKGISITCQLQTHLFITETETSVFLLQLLFRIPMAFSPTGTSANVRDRDDSSRTDVTFLGRRPVVAGALGSSKAGDISSQEDLRRLVVAKHPR